jgi:molybdopterin-binding protein
MSIPASRLAKVNPGVLNGGGSSLVMNGLFMTVSTLMPTGQVLSFPSALAVSNFFGPATAEAAAAVIYFNGYTTSTMKPGAMLFAAYNLAARAAFLQGAPLVGMTLAQLQALTGTIVLTVNGTLATSTTINLSAATSFSQAATLMIAAFTGPTFTITWNAVSSAYVFTSTLTGVTATITYAGGTLAGGLNLTTGGILSQGAIADTPTSALANAVALSQNFATIVFLAEPTLANKTLAAVWANAQNYAYGLILSDSDPNASVQGNQTCFGYLAKQAAYNGVITISGDPAYALQQATTLGALALNVAIALSGSIASINFTAKNGRQDAAFMSFAGVTATVASDPISQNLLANGYNFHGAYGAANQSWTLFQNGQMPGAFPWFDSFVNQIYLNSQMQLALIGLETAIGSVPYNPSGYGLTRNVLMGTIAAAIAFGTIRTGVTLSAVEISAVNLAAGTAVDSIIATQGFYLQILDPGAQVRALRGSPIINFWYTDGQSIQALNLSSIDIQ